MKKTVLILVFCANLLLLNAQIIAKIEKVGLGPSTYIMVTLTNTSNNRIYIHDGGCIYASDNGIADYSPSYVVYSSFSGSQTLLGKSDKYPFSLPDDNRRISIKLEKGQSWTSKVFLFTQRGTYGLFKSELLSSIKYLKADIHLMYFRNGIDTTFQHIDIETNQISF